MSTKERYTLTVVPDTYVENFSTSSCNCSTCTHMHIAQTEWDSFQPKTRLQTRMKNVISKIENDIKSKNG